MAYHDDLLQQAVALVHTAPPTQASLRRAVSTAYYAVFHLLIAEAVANWSNAALRPQLGRAYDHGTMRQASVQTANKGFTGEDPIAVAGLRLVARTFDELYGQRHFADYNLTKDLTPTEGLSQVASAVTVFKTWPSIGSAQVAQEYLVSLVVNPKRAN